MSDFVAVATGMQWEDCCTGPKRINSSGRRRHTPQTHTRTHTYIQTTQTDSPTHRHTYCIDFGCGCLRGLHHAVSTPWAINTYSCFTRRRCVAGTVLVDGESQTKGTAEGARLSGQSHISGNRGWPRKRAIAKAKDELQDQRVRGTSKAGSERTAQSVYDEWVRTWCDKRNFMFQAECRNCKADPTPAEKEQGTSKTEGIPPWTNTPSCTSEEGGGPQNMSEQSGRKVDQVLQKACPPGEETR